MVGAKRIFNPAPGMRLYLRLQRLAHQNRRALPGGSLASTGCPCGSCPDRHDWLACIQTLAGYGTMVVAERSGL